MINFFVLERNKIQIIFFKYKSFYEDEKENKVTEETAEYESSNLDELFKTLDEEDYDDEIAINFNAKSNLNVTERDYIKILDENKKEVYKEE